MYKWFPLFNNEKIGCWIQRLVVTHYDGWTFRLCKNHYNLNVIFYRYMVKIKKISYVKRLTCENVWSCWCCKHINRLSNKYLLMKKLSWWVLLTVNYKHIRINVSQKYSVLFQHNQTEFLHWFIAVDEMCIHHYMQETKQ